MKRIMVLLLMSLLATGCSSLQGQFENRLSMTLAGDKLLINSMYGSFLGITTVVSEKDRAALADFLARPVPTEPVQNRW